MADQRFQDFTAKAVPAASDELVGFQPGSGYIRSPVSAFATAAQGALAATALQPGGVDNVSELINDAGYATGGGTATGDNTGDDPGYGLIQQDDVSVAQEYTLNFEGTGVTVTPEVGKTTITIPGAVGGGYTTVEQDDVAVTQRNVLNFEGTGVVVADDAGTKTTVTISGGGDVSTSSNDGTGEGLAKAKVGSDLPFKSLVGGDGIVVSSDADEVTIQAIVDFFNARKPAGEDIFISGLGQSLLTPTISDDTGALPNNPNVEDFCTGDGLGMAFRQLDPNDTPYADYSLANAYTGHQRGGKGGIFLGLANRLQLIAQRDVKTCVTHWGSHNLSQHFNPFLQDTGGGEGTGYTEFVTQMKAVQALADPNIPTYPDIHIHLVGETDKDLVSEASYAEHYFNLMRHLRMAGVIGPDTIIMFFDRTDDYSQGADWNIYRTVHELEGPNSIIACTNGTDTADWIHWGGNTQVGIGDNAAYLLANYPQAKPVIGGSRFKRSQSQMVFYANLVAPGAATALTKQWQTDISGASATKLRISWEGWYNIAATLPMRTHTDQWREVWRVKIAETGSEANFITYDIAAPGVWSDTLPDAAGTPNRMEFDVTFGTTGGVWPPTGGAGTQCTITLQRYTIGGGYSKALVGRDEEGLIGSNSGGTTYSMPLILNRLTGQAVDINVISDGTVRTVLADSEIEVFYESVGQIGMLEQIAYITPNVAKTGLLRTRAILSGIRTDAPAADRIYSARLTVFSHFHTAGDAIQSYVTNYYSALTNTFNPSGVPWTTPFGPHPLAAVASQGHFNRNTPLVCPGIAGQTWEWRFKLLLEWMPT